MKKIKLVIVGPGLIGKQHIHRIHENDRCELVAIVAPNRPTNHDIARKNQVPLYQELPACLEQENVDGVIISSPNHFHFEQGRFCIESRVPVLIEKPITPDIEEGRVLADLADRNDSKVLIGHHRAHSPIMTMSRDVIQSGRLGKLVSIIGSAQFYKPDQYFIDGPWRKEVGGGPILINLIHEIGNFRSLCGEISAVQAISSSAIRCFPVEDTVAINFLFENGVLGTFLLSDTAATAKSWEQTSRENPSYPAYQDEDCYTVTGTAGSISIPTMRIKLYPPGATPSWWMPFLEENIEIARKDPLSCQLQHFIDIIEGKVSPLVSARDGFRNLQITEAIKISARQQRLIYV